MELGMKSQIRNTPIRRRQERMNRAAWWFARMRRVVDLAMPPQSRVAQMGVRHEQTYFSLRQTNLL
jgi:hypothetical protein